MFIVLTIIYWLRLATLVVVIVVVFNCIYIFLLNDSLGIVIIVAVHTFVNIILAFRGDKRIKEETKYIGEE